MDQIHSPKRQGAKFGWGILAGWITVSLIGILSLLAVVPAVWPTMGAQIADAIRAVVGPKPVAVLEGGSLAIQDAINRIVSAHDGGQKTISLAQTNTAGISPKMQGPMDQLAQLHWGMARSDRQSRHCRALMCLARPRKSAGRPSVRR
jgi:hypothetical protein